MINIPVSEVILDDRIRRDYGEVAELADSIITYGFIHPPAIDQNKTLVAGGRRWAAIQNILKRKVEDSWEPSIVRLHQTQLLELGVHFSFKPTISIDHLGELELEENVQRKQMSWQEYCIGVAKVHKLKQRSAALASSNWGNRQTAMLFKISTGKIDYVLHVAKHLADEKSVLWHCDSITDAIQKLAALKLEEMNRGIASQSVANLPKQTSLAGNYVNKTRADDDFFTVTPRTVDLAAEFGSPAGTPREKGAAPELAGVDAGGPGGSPPAQRPDKIVIDLREQLTNLPWEAFYNAASEHKAKLIIGLQDFDHEISFYQPKDNQWILTMSPRVDCLNAVQHPHPLIYVDTGKNDNATEGDTFRKNYTHFYLARGEKAKLVEFQNSSVYIGTSEADRLLFGKDNSVYPDAFWTWILKALVKRGDTIICPSVGSGSLIRTCIKLGIKFICNEPNFELYQKAYKIASQTYMQILPNVEIEPLH